MSTGHLEKLDAEQRLAVEHRSFDGPADAPAPLLVIAGAGSGELPDVPTLSETLPQAAAVRGTARHVCHISDSIGEAQAC